MGDSQGRAAEDHGSPAAAVFDALGAAYEQAFAASAAHRESLERLLAGLAPGSRVLDVGSGTGRPTAQTLADAGHRVLGVDVSPVMTALAARQVPGAEFRCADIRDFPLAEGEFDAVCVYFSLLQLGRGEQADLMERLVRSLRPGGLLVAATVPVDVAGSTRCSWDSRSGSPASAPRSSPPWSYGRGPPWSGRTARCSPRTTRRANPSRTSSRTAAASDDAGPPLETLHTLHPLAITKNKPNE